MNSVLLFQISGATLSSNAGLLIHSEPQTVAVSEPPPPSSIDPKGKKVRSLYPIEGTRKVKKSRGLPPSPNLALSFNKVPVMEMEAEARASIDLGCVTLTNASEAPKEIEGGPMAVMETQIEVDEARASTMESLIWVTVDREG